MVGTKVLFDTNILIDYLNGILDARAELQRHHDCAISVITWMEVMAGATKEDEAKVRSFLLTFPVLSITSLVADRAVVLRRQRKLKLPDAIILATAEVNDRILTTRNTRDFSADDASVRIPYTRST